jgi:cytoskeletal protein CcmA (bactofilin family)
MSDKMQRSEGKLDTIIGKGTRIEGTIKVEGATRIDGFVSGKLESNDVVTIGPEGEVKAEVRAKSIIVGVKVEGNLEASEKIELQSKAELHGDLISKSLLVEHGAIFHGNSNMKGTPPKQVKPQQPNQNQTPGK